MDPDINAADESSQMVAKNKKIYYKNTAENC